jgi:hypothetical protein
MNLKRICYTIFILTIIIIAVYSCQDIGTDITLPPELNASVTNVSVSKGTTVQVTLSGGRQPYIIRKQPNNAIATVSLNSSILSIFGADTGSTSAIMVDSKVPIADSLEIHISVLGTIHTVSFSSQIQPIFNSQCTNCHGGSGGLTITAGASYNNMVNVDAQSSCTSLKRVLPNNANNSVLYRKVSGTTCGNRMPGGVPMNADEIALIQDWINQGANNN